MNENGQWDEDGEEEESYAEKRSLYINIVKVSISKIFDAKRKTLLRQAFTVLSSPMKSARTITVSKGHMRPDEESMQDQAITDDGSVQESFASSFSATESITHKTAYVGSEGLQSIKDKYGKPESSSVSRSAEWLSSASKRAPLALNVSQSFDLERLEKQVDFLRSDRRKLEQHSRTQISSQSDHIADLKTLVRQYKSEYDLMKKDAMDKERALQLSVLQIGAIKEENKKLVYELSRSKRQHSLQLKIEKDGKNLDSFFASFIFRI
jgi:hypothetical protein